MTTEELYEIARQVWNTFQVRRGWFKRIERADAIQDAVLRCWRHVGKHDATKASARTYFSLVARHAIDMRCERAARLYRAGKRTMSLDDAEFSGFSLYEFLVEPSACPAVTEEVADDLRALREAIANLPAPLRHVIEQRNAGHPDVYTARALGVSRQAIQQKHAQAVDLLRETMVGCS